MSTCPDSLSLSLSLSLSQLSLFLSLSLSLSLSLARSLRVVRVSLASASGPPRRLARPGLQFARAYRPATWPRYPATWVASLPGPVDAYGVAQSRAETAVSLPAQAMLAP